MDKIVALCKRRGLIFPASEIYGGIANTYDYGHYGVLLKNNVIAAWWKAMIQERDDIVALGLPKDSPLTPALHAAMQTLIDSPAYQETLDRWGLGAGAIDESQIVG